jgi:hypothetical protein
MKKIAPYKKLLLALIVFAGLATACKKDYYMDTGLAKGRFNGSIMKYLESKPFYFDTLVQVIKIAGMEDILAKEKVTFFAPPNMCFDSTLSMTNKLLYADGKDTIVRLEQVPAEVWRKMLGRYVFKGKNMLNDYPQLDPVYFATYPGQFYTSYYGDLMNVGVIYGSEGGAQYAGYRQLVISYTPDITFKPISWLSCFIASVNIEPDNGAVHVVRFAGGFTELENNVLIYQPGHYFGFDPYEFYLLCKQYGVGE